MKIGIKTFNGIIPAKDPKLLPDNAALIAKNVNLDGGNLTPLKETSSVETLPDSSRKTIYPYRSGGSTTWLSWTLDNISVVKSPINQDQYSRIYWTGETDGKLKCKGTFGQRDIGFSAPTSPGTPSVSNLYSPSFACYWNASGQSSVQCTLDKQTKTSTGYSLTFRFPGASASGLSTVPDMYWSVTITGVGTITVSALGSKYAQTDNGTTWAEIELTNLSGYGELETSGSSPSISAVWHECTVTVDINMNYRFQDTNYFYYVMTYVDDLGVEGPPSDISDLVVRKADQKVTLSSIPVGTGNATKKRLYRSATGSSTTGFYFVDEITNATTSYVDWNRDSDLSEKITVKENPEDDMQGIVMMPGGFALAFKDRTIYASEPYHIHSWPEDYQRTAGSDIVGIIVAGNDALIVTEGIPEMLSGSHPSTLRHSKLAANQSCKSARSLCNIGGNVAFASPDGIVVSSGGSLVVASKQYIQRDQWQSYLPSTMLAEVHDEKIHLFSSNKSMVFSFGEGINTCTTIDETPAGLFSDPETDNLYMIIDDEIHSYNTSSTVKQLQWKSREFFSERVWAPNCCRLVADNYSASPNSPILKVYANNVEVASITFTNNQARRLPILRAEKTWSFEVLSYDTVTQVDIATSIQELMG